MNEFSRLKLIEPLRKALAEVGYSEMTPVHRCVSWLEMDSPIIDWA